jgi:signal transduction histidine kinase
MLKFNLRTRALLAATLFALVILGTVLFVVLRLEHSADEIIISSKLVTESAVFQLSNSGKSFIDSLVLAGFFKITNLRKTDEKRVDSILSAITTEQLVSYHGMEGGYYFHQTDVFLGYSFPSSPYPKPAFGPPPRSYSIIREQAKRSIEQQKRITYIHAFDPATFPLVTDPIIINGEIVGCSWARVHIERLIPTLELTDVLLIAAAFSLVGFIILLVGAWNMRKRVEEIRLGLEHLHTDSHHRFPDRHGVFGEITRSINEMIEARVIEQQRREKLEHDLHQKDKMVTLGTLIAGVAHEVKTPLAIIKTRIQMWQKKFELQENNDISSSIISRESMELVISEINRLTDLVKRLLVFSKPVSSKLRPSDINQILKQTIMLIRTEAEIKKIELEINLDPSIPNIYVDSQALEQVFLNLITNSIEAMPNGGILSIRSLISENRKLVQIDIQDNGEGIQSDIIDKIFNPFFTTKEHGVGLGLSISYEIIRAHNGSIEFIHTESMGTYCRVCLPVELSHKLKKV